MSEFICKTKIISGSGSIKQIADLKAKRLFVVADPYFGENGTAKKLMDMSGAQETYLFSKVAPDPSVELVAQGTEAVRSFRPDTLVALGGGSAMDCAKAMAYFAGGDITLVAIPTTSGSGSEVTDFAVLTHKETKHPLVDEKLTPAVAILDSDLLSELPRGLIADTGFDVLSHALEGLVAKNAGAVTDALAKEAFSTAFALLPASYGGDKTVRMKLHDAACMAGMAFNQAGLGLCHAMSHVLGGAFHLPHGRLNAILLPAVIDCNAHVASAKYAAAARHAGMVASADSVAVRNLKNGLIRLRRELQMPQTLKEAGIDPRQVWHLQNQLVEGILQDPCIATNPMRVEDFMVRRILEEVTGRV